MSATVELKGLEVPGAHGVEEAERQAPQRFLYDVRLELAEPRSDSVEETIDYREVVSCIREISAGRQFQLLETMAAAVADALVARFDPEAAWVRVRKPDVRLAAPVEWTAATAERRRP
jgi:dihydroneopterin aldolase